jgi:predicted HTH domain antitoxin
MAEVKLQVPDAIAKEFGLTDESIAREFLEAGAAEGYRSGRLSHGQVRQLLNLSWHETESFLKKHNCFLHYSVEDLEQDRENLEKLLGP